MPPEVLTGIQDRGQQIMSDIDAFAQVTPDLALDWSLLKMQFQRILAKIQLAGGQPISSTNTGPNFSGGGIDRGMAAPGA